MIFYREFLLCAGIMFCASGCALHYCNAKNGTEHLWGLGQLRLQNQSAGSNYVAVVTGIRAPGLCLEVGRDHFGFTFGYLNRQRLEVVSTNTIANLQFPVVSPRICAFGSTNAPWAWGHLQMVAVPSPTHHYAIVTGKALAGLGAGMGNQDNNFGFAMDGRQRAVVLDENVRLDFDQDVPRWPGFDLFTMRVNATTPD